MRKLLMAALLALNSCGVGVVEYTKLPDGGVVEAPEAGSNDYGSAASNNAGPQTAPNSDNTPGNCNWAECAAPNQAGGNSDPNPNPDEQQLAHPYQFQRWDGINSFHH